MADKLERLYEYRTLVAKREQLRLPLSPDETARAERLSGRVRQGVPQVDEADPYTLVPQPWQVHVAHGGQSVEGTVPNASGDGMAIQTSNPPPLGSEVVLTVRHPRHGIEYAFPGRVVWRVVQGGPAFGVAFAGAPTESSLGGRRSGVYRADDTPADASKRERHSA